ncbi:MAG: RNA polymerase sigma-70 factor (ECF subfamily) [Bacteroidia bacterium]
MLTNLHLQQLYNEHQPSLLNFAIYLVGNREDSLEIVNDVYVSLWQNRKSFSQIKAIKSYLFSSVKNRSINHIKKKKLEVTNLWPENEQSTFRADAGIEEKEHQTALENLMNELPPKCKQVFAMSRIDQLSYAEIAELLDISIKTVESQMGKALKLFRKKMGVK